MENYRSVHSSCWLNELEHIITPLTPFAPLTPITPATSLNTAGFGLESTSCSYLDLTPPASDNSQDDGRIYRNWSCQWKRCSKCRAPVNAHEAAVNIMDASFHKSCVRCTVCCKHIRNSDSFGVTENRIYCSVHFRAATLVQCQFGDRKAWNQNIESTQERLRESVNRTEDSYPALRNLVLGEKNEAQRSARKMDCSSSHKSKRVRTSFTKDQLDSLTDFFKTCQKPTTQQLEEISSTTGLKINILRVWFQNSRARLRRSSSDETKENIIALNVPQ